MALPAPRDTRSVLGKAPGRRWGRGLRCCSGSRAWHCPEPLWGILPQIPVLGVIAFSTNSCPWGYCFYHPELRVDGKFRNDVKT